MAKRTPRPGTSLDVRSLPGPETIVRRQLANGITLLARENFSSPSVVLSGYLAVGAIDEPDAQAGLADLTAAALMRGADKMDFRQIYERLESRGASLGFGAGTHQTTFRGRALAEDLGLLLATLSATLRQPSFPKDQVQRLRSEKLTGLAIRDQDTGSVAQMAFEELAYPDHPYRLPGDGFVDTVSKLREKDLRRFHRERYGPQGMTVAVVGAVAADSVLDSIEAALGDWRNPRQQSQRPLPALRPLVGLTRKDTFLSEKSQCDVVMGAPGPSRMDPEYLPAALANSVLGGFGLMGRLGAAVRKQAGLAYHASSQLGGGLGPTPWQVVAGVAPANVERALELARAEIRRMGQRKVSQQELEDNQANFIGRLPLQMESNDGVAAALMSIERYSLPLDFFQQYPALLLAITPEQLRQAVRRYLNPDNLAIAVAGSLTSGA
jgi:zinc protease